MQNNDGQTDGNAIVASSVAPPQMAFSRRQIFTASYLGGPLAGAWFQSRNFNAQSNPVSSRKSLLYGFVAIALLFPLLLVIPAKFPNSLIPALYSGYYYYFAKANLRKVPPGSMAIGSGWKHWLKLLGMSMLLCGVTLMIWLAAYFALDLIRPGLLD